MSLILRTTLVQTYDYAQTESETEKTLLVEKQFVDLHQDTALAHNATLS